VSVRRHGASSFARAVESRLESILKRPVVLSPRDWTTLAGWHARGIPLPLVLETLQEVAARKGGGQARSLRYFVRAVEESWQAVLDGRAIRHRGAASGTSAGGESREAPWSAKTRPGERPPSLERLLEDLSKALARGTDPAVIDETLDRALAEGSIAPEIHRASRQEALEALGNYRGRMSAAAWDKTLRRAVVERMRRSLGLPRLRPSRPVV
jgi:hypothetical protein